MTAHRDLKGIIRARQRETGEPYTTARSHVLRAQAKLMGLEDESTGAQDAGVDGRQSVYRIRATLLDVDPPIWRLIEVPASYSFWGLHVAIQDAMGWLDYHLHLFRVPNPETGEVEEIGIPDPDPFEDEVPCLPGWNVPISRWLQKPGDRAGYEYDFGDGWEHELVVEEIAAHGSRRKFPRCVAGERACPPEDCGGPDGYRDLLRILADPMDEQHESMLVWVGGSYDPAAFDPRKVRFEDPDERWEIAFRSGGR